MRAVSQRVKSASVCVSGSVVGEIRAGLLAYLGASPTDGSDTVGWMVNKLSGLRIFQDEQGKMSLDVSSAGGEVLVVPQFTLYGDVRKGRRPSFEGAAPPDQARQLYEDVCAGLRERGLSVQTGRFRETMEVSACVDGPVTILIDSERKF